MAAALVAAASIKIKKPGTRWYVCRVYLCGQTVSLVAV